MAGWCDVDVRKTLTTAGRVFEVDVQLQTNAPRIVLMGPSGIGKTMVLQAIAGLVRPDAGHIRLNGNVLFDAAAGRHLTPQKRRVGYLFQNYALLPHLTALSNVGFGLRKGAWGFLSAADKQQAMQWLERFELGHVADQYPHTLSGGQQQRLALARLTIVKPQVLLLDEPFSALDPALRESMRAEVAQMVDRLGIPLIMVSHDEQDCMALKAQVVRLESRAGRTVCLPAS